MMLVESQTVTAIDRNGTSSEKLSTALPLSLSESSKSA